MFKSYNSSKLELKNSSCSDSPYQVKSEFKLFEPISSARLFMRTNTSSDIRPSLRTLSQKTSNFLKKLEEYEVPESLVQVYQNFLSTLSVSKSFKFIQQELICLRNNRSLVQMAISSYNLWINSIEKIKQVEISALSDPRWKVSQVFISGLISILTDHAYITLILAENIQAWESSLKNLIFPEEDSIDFIIDNKKVITELISSCDFLFNSELSYYFSFSISDPFLLSISKRQRTAANSSLGSRNFYSSRDCKDLFYIQIEKEAYLKMKQLSKSIIKKDTKIVIKPTIRKTKTHLSLPNLKINSKKLKNTQNQALTESILNDLIKSQLAKDIQVHLNKHLAEKIHFEFLAAEVKRNVNHIAKKYYNQELKKAQDLARRKEENVNIGKLLLEQILDAAYFEYLKAEEFCSEILEELQEHQRVEDELRTKAENFWITQGYYDELYENSIETEDLKLAVDDAIVELIEEKREIELELQRIAEENQRISELISEEYIEAVAILEQLSEVSEQSHSEAVNERELQLKLEESSKKAWNLLLSTMYEGIVRNLIEDLIVSSSLSSICEEIMRDELKTQESAKQLKILERIQAEKLQIALYSDLIEQFLLSKWLEDLCKNMIKFEESHVSVYSNAGFNESLNKQVEKPEEFVMEVFTPGVHSPNEVSIDYTQNQSLHQSESILFDTPRVGFEFNKGMKSVKNPVLKPFMEKSKNLKEVVESYENAFFSEFKDFLYFGLDLVFECGKCWNSRYFWISEESKVVGMLVYSDFGEGIVVNHISVLNLELLGDTCKLVLGDELGKYSKVVVKFKKVPGKGVIESLAEVGYNSEGVPNEFVRNASNSLEESKQLLNLNKDVDIASTGSKSFVTQANSTIKIASSQTVFTTNTETFPNPPQTSYPDSGSRIHLLSIISTILSEHPSKLLPDSLENNLQQDLSEILQLTTFTSLPQIPDQQLKIDASISHSSMPLSLSIFTINIIQVEQSKKLQKFLSIPKNKIKLKNNHAGSQLFIIESCNPDYSLFVYTSPELSEELLENQKLSKLDLFSHVNEMFRSLDGPEEFDKDLWVPCFCVQGSWELDWIIGFNIEDEEGETSYIEKCKEEMLIEFGLGECNTSLKFTGKKMSLDEDFIFGVVHNDLYEMFEIPLLASLVKRSNWM